MIPLFHKGVTVFFNFFKKSATKQLLAYRYGARKGNLTFFSKQLIKSSIAVPIWSERRKVLKNVGRPS